MGWGGGGGVVGGKGVELDRCVMNVDKRVGFNRAVLLVTFLVIPAS